MDRQTHIWLYVFTFSGQRLNFSLTRRFECFVLFLPLLRKA